MQKEISHIKNYINKTTEMVDTPNSSNPNFLIILLEIAYKKWIIKVTIKINNEFTIYITTLFDTEANLKLV